MTDAERTIIENHLPENFQWENVTYTLMGNFSQLLYNGQLVGYIMNEEGTLVFKRKGLKK